VIALLIFGTVVALLVHVSELKELGRLLHQIRKIWLIAAALLQSLTYFCAAGVWYVTLKPRRRGLTITSLVLIALAMLFANQAFPTAGLSGSIIVVRALRKRRIPANVAMGALLIGLMTTYIAYLLAVLFSLLLLAHHAVSDGLLLITAIFAMAAVGIPAAVIWYRESLAPRMRTRLRRIPGVGALLDAIGTVPTTLLHDRGILSRALAFQLAEIVLDAATLQVMLIAIGVHAAPSGVFASFVMAFAVSQLMPVPLGLGTFEAALVGMLRLVGVALEPALTATLLLRGFTLWLPMLPGLWFARRELWPRRG
jgi:uncharacterized membrane protein YbhN (UPF0104 family)